MHNHDSERHPGPWRIMRVETGLVGVVIAIGFLIMGFVSMPIAAWFVFGAAVLGAGIAVLLRFNRKE